MKIVIENATGERYNAEKIEGGYRLYTMGGERYKKLKDAVVERDYTFEEAEEMSEDKRKKVIFKIKKMLNLSENNPSKEEATSAALQAQKLMMKYNIHKDEVTLEEIQDEIESVFTDQPKNSELMRWRKTLALIVARSFRCKTYLSGRDVVFRGYREDANIAKEVYLTLYNIGNRIARRAESKYCSMSGSAKGVYNSTAIGFLKGVEDALNEQCTALMVITPKEVEEEFEQFSQNFTQAKITLKSSNSEAYREGYREGRSSAGDFKTKKLEDKSN